MALAGVPSGKKLGNAAPRTARIVTLRPADRNDRVPSEEECCGLLRSIALDRDRAAFAELFGHFAPRVKGFLMRYGLPDVLSEDLAQETMLTVWRKADRFDPARAGVSTWIFTIARNKRIDRLRRDRGAATARFDASDEMEDCGSSEELAIAAETAEQVRAAMAALPDNQAEIVRLSFFAEKPHAEDRAGTRYSSRHREVTRAPRARSPARPAGGPDMTLERHPSDESLLRYAAGSLSAGPSLVVAAHLELCPLCRAQVAKFERLGGAFLADTARAPMRADALGRALEKLDQTPPARVSGAGFRSRPVAPISECRFRPRCAIAALVHGDGSDPASDGAGSPFRAVRTRGSCSFGEARPATAGPRAHRRGVHPHSERVAV